MFLTRFFMWKVLSVPCLAFRQVRDFALDLDLFFFFDNMGIIPGLKAYYTYVIP